MLITRREFTFAVVASSLTLRVYAQSQSKQAQSNESSRVRALLTDWVDRQHQSLGVVAGTIDSNGEMIESYGVMGLSDSRPMEASTVFGIASLTKVFTGLLLADAVLRKEVSLDDPVRMYLPQGVRIPTFESREITLRDLAMHATGFPQEIPDYAVVASNVGSDPNKPLFDFLATHELSRPIGAEWSYSNMNYALIGIALARCTGRSYSQLIHERIARPLKMHSTGIEITSEMKKRRASPHVDSKTPAPEWNKPWSLGAGSLQSTVPDLLKFVACASGITQSKLSPAFAAMQTTTRRAPFLGGEQAIGWGIDKSSGDPRVHFAGRAPGFSSAMMFDPKTRCGAVVLGNSSLMVESLAREILRPGSVAAAAATTMTIGPDRSLDRLVGRYVLAEALPDARFAAGEIVEITRTPTSIATLMPRYPKVTLKSLGDGVFQIEGFPVRLLFPGGEEAAPKLTITVSGKTIEAIRQ